MKITLITTLPGLVENTRIKEEVEKLGHEFTSVVLDDFEFAIKDNNLSVTGLTDLKADVVIVRGVFSSIKTIAAIVKKLKGRGIRVFDNNFLEHRYSIDKVTDIVKLSLNGIPTPNTYYSRDWADYPKFGDKLGYPVVLKSTRMGKGAGVFKADSREELDQLIENLNSEDKNAKSYIMQEFVDYKYDLRVLVIGERVYCMRRIPGEGEFRANFSLGGAVELFDLDEEGKQLALKALNSIGMSCGGVDVLIDKDDNRYILEVNHTAGMLGMEQATGENITRIYVEHAINSATAE